jgi:hypothetical protein
MIRGATQEEAEARIAERRRINEQAEKIAGKPIHAWPPFAVKWDTHPSSYHFSQDGVDYEALDGSNVTLMWVTLSELDAVLQAWNLRTTEEVWSIGDERKAAKVIVHCFEGRKLSPVWVCPTASGKLGLVGGNHRLAVARAKGETEVPTIFHDKHEPGVVSLFPERVSLRGS